MLQPATWILIGISYAAIPVGLYAFVHALMQRADAFTAVDKLTKPAWLGITGGATLALAIFRFGDAGSLFWMAAVVAVLVYLVDVRPRVNEAQRGPRW
ncbi:membrane associated rhomboid family serine protease [Crossiella equi]|uniref:Membrane associated rhomboid family serine protease n=1 Tax=Crossiella equi TaxID=130796 RepID=A0ABS5AHB0_9PSEU|nr:DUF2516 family protein [Crossiella equi]MBP2475961.1 membrane associated rhomboid family serine protease [Crossiella equi]